MKYSWLHKEGRDRLLVFCNGWGMDPRPFLVLAASAYDVLNLYDFRNVRECGAPLDLLAEYDERLLLGWSMGVWAGQQLFAGHEQLFTRTIAVNGTLCPVDDRYGIPRKLFAGTMEGWSESARHRFYRRLCGEREVEERFLQNQPLRSLADQQDELAYYLETAGHLERERSIYREVVISAKDRIVPTAHQLAYWGEAGVVRLAGGHFPFYCWDCWDDLLKHVHDERKAR